MKYRVARLVLAAFIAPFAILPVIAFPSTLVLGLSAYFLMLHFGKASFALFGVAGAVISAAGVLLFFEPLRDANNTGFVALIIASGAAVAVAFRGIARAPGR